MSNMLLGSSRTYMYYLVVIALVVITVVPLFFFEGEITGLITFNTSTEAGFNEGTYNLTFYNSTEGFVQLNASNTTGNYTSKVFDSGSNANWDNMTWTEGTLYGEDLPDNNGAETVQGGINMSGNILLMHMDESATNQAPGGYDTGDGSGNGLYGTDTGTLTYGATGVYGTSYEFSGSNDLIIINDTSLLDLSGNFTIEFWVKRSEEEFKTIIMKAIAKAANYDGWWVEMWTNDRLAAGIQDGAAPDFRWVGCINVNNNDNQWHHYAITMDRTNVSNIKMYCDGVNNITTIDSQADLDTIGDMTNNYDVTLGNEEDDPAGYNFNGWMDELVIYNRVLSEEEIILRYKRGGMKLNITTRSCNDDVCSGESWNETHTNGTFSTLQESDNRYFQYKVNFETGNSLYTPELYNVSVNYTLLDIASPNTTLNLPTNNTNYSIQNITFNFTTIEDYPPNLNCSLYINGTFESGNSSTVNDTLTELNGTDITGGLSYWNIICLDGALNSNTSETRWFYIDVFPPVVSSINYYPNSTDDMDPGTNVTFNATITDDWKGISVIILQYHNGTEWTNETMTNIEGDVYQANITTITGEVNYTYRIWANDSFSNANTSDNVTFNSSWDCTWTSNPTAIGTASGWDENKWITNISINNTGDPNYTVNNCSLDFRLTYDLAEGRIYFDGSYYKPSNIYTVSAEDNQTVVVNTTFLSEVFEEAFTINISELTARSTTDLRDATGTLISTSGGPYLYQDMTTEPPSALYLTNQNFNLGAYIRNVVGDGTVNNTAYNVTFNWSLPTNFLVSSGTAAQLYGNLSNSSVIYNNISVLFNSTNLEDMEAGTFTVYLYARGYNNTSDLIVHSGGRTLLTEQASIELSCYYASDDICVTDCGYLLDSDCEQAAGPTGGGGGGGGPSKKTSKLFQTSEIFELVRGRDQSFVLKVTNPFSDVPLDDVSVSVEGFYAEYISLSPTSVDQIPAGGSYDFTVDIISPKYFTTGSYNLTFNIESSITRELLNATVTTEVVETKIISLEIHELSRGEAEELLGLSIRMLKEMQEEGFYTRDIEIMVEESRDSFNDRDYENVQSLYNDIKEIRDDAFSIEESVNELTGMIILAEEMGADVDQTLRLLNLIKAAFERGDYVTAVERVKEAMLTYALETRGVFNPIFFIKSNWEIISILAIIAVIGSIVSYFRLRVVFINRRLKKLRKQEKLLLRLMKSIQKECFEDKKMSMKEYQEALKQYETKLNWSIAEIIRLETEKANLLKFGSKEKRLIQEHKLLSKLIKQTQRDYILKGKLNTRSYRNKMERYTERFTEIEEQLAIIESHKALKKRKTSKKLRKLKKRKIRKRKKVKK